MSPIFMLMALVSQAHFSDAEVQSIFEEGNQAYARGEYQKAAAAYENLVKHGHANADVFFNLGTAWVSAGKWGEAVFNLEMSRRESPSEDIDAQLAVAHSRMVDRLVDDGVSSSFEEWLLRQSQNPLWVWLFLGGWWALGLLLAFKIARRRQGLWAWLVGVFLVTGLAGGLLVLSHYRQRQTHEAVALSEKVEVRTLPEASAPSAFDIHAGLKVRVLEQKNEFLRVRLRNGLEGWAPVHSLAPLPAY